MQIVLEKTGKKFNTEWIFSGLSCTFDQGRAYAILGRNGSGKSTLLQVISGKIHPTAGSVIYRDGGRDIPETDYYRYLAMSAPYLELIEDFTLPEMLRFHFSFKKMIPGYTPGDLTDLLGFRDSGRKQIRLFSSGMKQRVRLVLAFFSDVPVILLDEPTTNLDPSGTDWFLQLARDFSGNRLLIVCSNLEQVETGFCSEKIHIESYKNRK